MIWVGGAERLSEGGGKQEEKGGAGRRGYRHLVMMPVEMGV